MARIGGKKMILLYNSLNTKLPCVDPRWVQIAYYSDSRKSWKKDIIIGIKHAWNIPTLPSNIENFHNHIFTRIFRVIGGMSIVAILSERAKLYLYPSEVLWPLYYLILFFGLLHIIYIIIIKIIKFNHMIKILRSGKLDVYNSPFNKLASLTARAYHCWKIGCDAGSIGFSTVGAGFIIDQILEAGDQNKIFTPLIGKGVKYILKPIKEETLFEKIERQTRELKKTQEYMERNQEIIDQAAKYLQESNNLTKNEIKDLDNILKEIKDMDAKKHKEISKELMNNMQNLTKKK